jgi:hypothetical protein
MQKCAPGGEKDLGRENRRPAAMGLLHGAGALHKKRYCGFGVVVCGWVASPGAGCVAGGGVCGEAAG